MPVAVKTKAEERIKSEVVKERSTDKLILKHLPQIKYIAQRMAAKLPPHIELDDLITAGVLGLIDAVKKFDPLRGTQFKTYADRRIKGAILDSLRNMDWISRSLRKKAKDLEKAFRKLEQKLGRHATNDEIAEELAISEEELEKWLTELRGISLGNFSNVVSCKNPEASLIKYQLDDQDPFLVLQRKEFKQLLSQAIDGLPKNESLVVSLYYYDELTMKEIGEVLGVNESRVSQLHTKAVLRLRTKLAGLIESKK